MHNETQQGKKAKDKMEELPEFQNQWFQNTKYKYIHSKTKRALSQRGKKAKDKLEELPQFQKQSLENTKFKYVQGKTKLGLSQ